MCVPAIRAILRDVRASWRRRDRCSARVDTPSRLLPTATPAGTPRQDPSAPRPIAGRGPALSSQSQLLSGVRRRQDALPFPSDQAPGTQTMHRQSAQALPALGRPHVASQVSGNLFPRLQPVTGPIRARFSFYFVGHGRPPPADSQIIGGLAHGGNRRHGATPVQAPPTAACCRLLRSAGRFMVVTACNGP